MQHAAESSQALPGSFGANMQSPTASGNAVMDKSLTTTRKKKGISMVIGRKLDVSQCSPGEFGAQDKLNESMRHSLEKINISGE